MLTPFNEGGRLGRKPALRAGVIRLRKPPAQLELRALVRDAQKSGSLGPKPRFLGVFGQFPAREKAYIQPSFQGHADVAKSFRGRAKLGRLKAPYLVCRSAKTPKPKDPP